MPEFRTGEIVTGAYGTTMYKHTGKVRTQRGGLVEIVDETGDIHTIGSSVVERMGRFMLSPVLKPRGEETNKSHRFDSIKHARDWLRGRHGYLGYGITDLNTGELIEAGDDRPSGPQITAKRVNGIWIQLPHRVREEKIM